jgi:hypothetical protein
MRRAIIIAIMAKLDITPTYNEETFSVEIRV